MFALSQPETALAVQALRAAARIGEKVKQHLSLYQMAKADLSPVTVADYAIQACVAQMLHAAFPGDQLVAEERAEALRAPGAEAIRQAVARFVAEEVPGAGEDQVCAWIDRGAAEPGERFWVLDPVDGTKGYVRGGQYAIALALVERGQVVLGALACPGLAPDCRQEGAGGALLVARRGEGAWAAPLADGSRGFDPLRVSPCSSPENIRILRSYESSHTNEQDIDNIAGRLGVRAAPVLMDSQAKYAVLAAGGAELLLRLLSPKQPDYRERIWDQAAGAIIIEEAGGRVTDLVGKPLDFGQGRLLENNRGIVATNGTLHDRALQAVSSICGGSGHVSVTERIESWQMPPQSDQS